VWDEPTRKLGREPLPAEGGRGERRREGIRESGSKRAAGGPPPGLYPSPAGLPAAGLFVCLFVVVACALHPVPSPNPISPPLPSAACRNSPEPRCQPRLAHLAQRSPAPGESQSHSAGQCQRLSLVARDPDERESWHRRKGREGSTPDLEDPGRAPTQPDRVSDPGSRSAGPSGFPASPPHAPGPAHARHPPSGPERRVAPAPLRAAPLGWAVGFGSVRSGRSARAWTGQGRLGKVELGGQARPAVGHSRRRRVCRRKLPARAQCRSARTRAGRRPATRPDD
jgi:hypothetical protein